MKVKRYAVSVEMVVRGCRLENHYLSVGAGSEAEALEQVTRALDGSKEVDSFTVLSISESLSEPS